MKKVLIFSLAYFPKHIGGAEVAIKEITDRIPSSLYEFHMVTLRFDSSLPRVEKIGNVNIERIGGGLGYLSKIFFVPQVAFFALRQHYDVYWVVMSNMLFPISLIRFLGNRTPYILTLQDGDTFEHVFKRWRIRLVLPLLKYGFKHAERVQTISNFLVEWTTRMGYRGETYVIPNGVDVEKFKSVKSVKSVKSRAFDRSGVVLITTSRLVEKNGVSDIIKAMKFLPKSVTLKILGSGPLEKSLKLLAEDLQLGPRVEFLGHISYEEIPEYLKTSDIFIRPSLSEGFGNSFVEAMAAGLPVIATAVGGIVDFLKDSVTGLFCEVRNPESIARQVKLLIDNPELRASIVSNAQKMVEEKYDWDIVAKDMQEKVFDTI